MKELYNRFYEKFFLIRRVEEIISDIYTTDVIKSPVHLSIGQESVSIGVCEALEERDVVFGTYRSHALYLAKGGGLKSLFAELYGKDTGCASGRGGSMHLVDTKVNVMGTSAIVASTIPLAVGYAYGEKLKNSDVVTAVFFGDGAIDEGVFYESLNFAKLKRLRVIFVLENNKYAIYSPIKNRRARKDLNGLARELVGLFGIPYYRLENDVSIIAVAAMEARWMSKDGPVFLECDTHRFKEHVGIGEDPEHGYDKKKDEFLRLRSKIKRKDRIAIEEDIDMEIDKAIKYAEVGPFPPKEDLYKYNYRRSSWYDE